MNKSFVPVAFLAAALAACGAQAAVHPTKAQEAYFDAHDECVRARRAAQQEARSAPDSDRKRMLDAAKKRYRQCEHHAHLIWKYYPLPPPPEQQPTPRPKQ